MKTARSSGVTSPMFQPFKEKPLVVDVKDVLNSSPPLWGLTCPVPIEFASVFTRVGTVHLLEHVNWIV